MTVFGLGERYAQGRDHVVSVDLVFNDPISQFVEGHSVPPQELALKRSKSREWLTDRYQLEEDRSGPLKWLPAPCAIATARLRTATEFAARFDTKPAS
jgi:hypothetical protein